MAALRKTALVTGASGGIGEDLARELARDGYDLVLLARTKSKLDALGAELSSKHGIETLSIAEDLADPAAPARIAAQLDEERIQVTVLVNNAGFGLRGAFESNDWPVERDMIQVNVTALVHLTKLLLPGMLERGEGRIMNVASTAAFQPGPLMAVYYATKAFVLSFSEAIGKEVAGTGVTVTALCPGPTATHFTEAADMSQSKLFKLGVVMSSSDVARIGYDGLKRGKRVVIPGVVNWLGATFGRFMPKILLLGLIARLHEPAAA